MMGETKGSMNTAGNPGRRVTERYRCTAVSSLPPQPSAAEIGGFTHVDNVDHGVVPLLIGPRTD